MLVFLIDLSSDIWDPFNIRVQNLRNINYLFCFNLLQPVNSHLLWFCRGIVVWFCTLHDLEMFLLFCIYNYGSSWLSWSHHFESFAIATMTWLTVKKYLCHKWLITGFVTRLTQQVPLVEQELLTLLEHLSSPPVFSRVRVTRSLALCVCFVDRCLSFCPFSFGHCVVCSSLIYGFWLLLWYLLTCGTLYAKWDGTSQREIHLPKVIRIKLFSLTFISLWSIYRRLGTTSTIEGMFLYRMWLSFLWRWT
jgi:hypothetical protein